MPFVKDEYTPVATGNSEIYHSGPQELKVNTANPFSQTDYGHIIKAFEVEASNWERTDYAKANHYRDVYSTRNFSQRVREQMDYYPGMHQSTSSVPANDPFYTNAKKKSEDKLNYWNNAMDNPEAFESGLRQNQKDFDYTKIFGTDASAEERASAYGKMLTECIPCFDRLLDGNALLPDGDILEIHALNIKIRTDLLDKVGALFKDPGSFVDICDLLKLLSHMCPSDLMAIIALLTQYIAKLNLDFKFNLDFIIQLVGPILSPFLDALSSWLDKWIQLIVAPITCVVDHINETIMTAQQSKIPLSSVSGNIEMDLGIAAPKHQNASGGFTAGGVTGVGEQESKGSTWTSWQWEEFNTPDKEKYNPNVPTPPSEEIELAKAEVAEAWSPSFSEAEREERNAKWQELRKREQQKRNEVPPPDRRENHDGTRWSKDDIPNSEKHTSGGSWEKGYHPPEQQSKPAEGIKYFVSTPIVNSIVQMRNILQGAVQYVKDWFTYITQMIYDLLGVDFGWMNKKADNTMIKSRIIEMILLVKSIAEAISKNGLECGTHSNFDQAQMKYILEDELNKVSDSKFKVLDDGTIRLYPPGKTATSSQLDTSVEPTVGISGLVPGQVISEPNRPVDKQKHVESGIIIKDCFKSVSQDELLQARAWIADFEKRGSV